MNTTVLVVDVGDGARMFVPAPSSMNEDGLEWQLRYGTVAAKRFQAASVVASMSYLICDAISTKEAIRRLRRMRAAYKAAMVKK